MEIRVEHLGAVQFEIKARHHVVLTDLPADNGGFDEGFTPPELLLGALGSCAAYYATDYLRRQRFETEGTIVTVSARKERSPARLDNIIVRVQPPIPLTLSQEVGIEKAIHGCLIHNTLINPPNMRIEILDCAKGLPGVA